MRKLKELVNLLLFGKAKRPIESALEKVGDAIKRGRIQKPPDLEKMYKRIEARSKELEQREALKQGIGVEESLQKEKDERIADVARTLGISAEEVLAQKLYEQPIYCIDLIARAKRLTAERGVTVTPNDVKAEDDKRLSKRVHFDFPEECYNLITNRYLIHEYVETGVLLPDVKAHLENCSRCYAEFEVPRQSYLTFNATPCPECLTQEELHAIHENGKIESERKRHAGSCGRCKMHFDKNIEMYLDKILPYQN